MRRGREEIPVMKKVFRRIRSSGGGRTLALVLSGALLLSTTGLGVYAADLDGSRNGEGGVVLSYSWPEGSGITWADEAERWTMTVPVEEDGAFNWGYVHDQLPQSIIAQVQPPQEDEAAESQESGPVPASRMGDETGLISTYSEGDAAGGDSADDANDTDGGDDATGTDNTDDANGTGGTDAAPSTGDAGTATGTDSTDDANGTDDGDTTSGGDNADTTPGTGDAGTTTGTDSTDDANGTGGAGTTTDGDSENTTPDGSNGNSNIVESPEERNVNLTWERTSEDSGTIMAEASLPAGYELSGSARALTVAVTAAPVELMDDSELSLSDFADFVVPEPDAPQGTVINLFDYWTEGGRDAVDNRYHLDAGINNKHSLKFGQGMATGTESINAYYSESAKPHTGIVESILKDGFPMLAAGNNWSLGNSIDDSKTTTEESLDYLFSTKDGTGKKAFANVEGLLQTDKDGYYYYNSQENYAYFDDDTDEFILYDTWGVKAKGSSPDGQFFPFASPEKVFTIDETSNELTQTGVLSNDGNLNHYFGLSMSTRFVQEEGGMTPGGNAVTYNFSGDDDVWVFIDDVLVADLGGIHDMLSLEINFSTGKVIVYDDTNTNNQYDKGETVFNNNNGSGTTLREMFKTAYKGGEESDWDGNTFADGTYHTLKFFYLERGHTDSNLSLKFNLTPIPESEITKVDQVGNPIADIKFDLYATEKDFSTANATLIWSGETDEKGNLKILDEESNSAIAFGEFAQEYGKNYFVLKEREVPDGYRSEGETRLEYDPGTGVILSRDYWTTGSYAAPKVMATAKGQLHYENESGALDLTDEDIDPSNPSTIPTVFAVVFKRLNMNELIDSDDNWAPISGSLESGWKVWNDTSIDIEKRILSAANDGKGGFKNTFAFGTGGAFQVTVEDLPGDVTSYYWYQAQKAGSGQLQESQVAYTVNYYYLDDSGNLHWLSTDDFTRRFSTHIYMSNIKDYLLVEKVNEKNEAMNGAEFALYKAEDLEKGDYLKTDGTVDLDALNKATNVSPYDSGTTGKLSGNVSGKGLLLFPTEDKVLEQGTYYLVETDSGNENYKINPTAVKVIVDETGVYADAGTKDDGVSTDRLVGSVLKSMLRFVRDDGVDATLNNIKVQILTAKEEPSENGKWDWSGWKENSTKEEEQHLYYYGRRDKNTYGMEYSPTGGNITLTDKTETGWNKLAVRQCLEHGVSTSTGTGDGNYTENGSLRQDLKGQDISNLFSSVMLVTVKMSLRPEN